MASTPTDPGTPGGPDPGGGGRSGYPSYTAMGNFDIARMPVPGNAEFLDNVRHEAIDQVKRLRNHPSIVIWCGNNEVETGWMHWGDRQQFKAEVGQKTAEKVWQDYMVLFNRVLPDVVVQYGQPVPYWPSSPSAN